MTPSDRDLLDAYVADELDDAGRAEFERRLGADAGLRRHLVEAALVEGDLHRLHQSAAGLPLAMPVRAAAPRRRQGWTFEAIAAALIAILGGVLFLRPSPPPAQGAETIRVEAGAVTVDGIAAVPRAGGELHAAGGEASLALAGGTRLTLAADARAVAHEQDAAGVWRVELRSGQVRCLAGAAGRVEIATPHAAVSVLGEATLLVTAGGERALEVSVHAGSARVRQGEGQVEIHAGSTRRFSGRPRANAVGQVQAVNVAGRTLTLTNGDRREARRLAIDAGATISIDGAAAALSDLPTGVAVTVHLDDSGQARRIEANGPEVTGRLLSIDRVAGELALTTGKEHATAPARYSLDPGLTATRDGVASDPATVSAGETVRLRLRIDGRTVRAIAIGQERRGEGR